MAKNRYNITFTETTHRLICGLEKYGHNVRDIINAGIVLFDEADNPTRAKAHMKAYSNLPEEIKDLERRLEFAKTQYQIQASGMEAIKAGMGQDPSDKSNHKKETG